MDLLGRQGGKNLGLRSQGAGGTIDTVKSHFKIAFGAIAAVPDGDFDPMPSGRWIAAA